MTFPENPILTRELRTRMRGARATWLLFAYVGVLALVLFIAYMSWARSEVTGDDLGGGRATFSVGKMFYQLLFAIQAVLVSMIAPALTAGGISLEKEQRTYEMLTVSLLPRRSIVLGKLTSVVSFLGLLLLSSLPLVSLCFLLGGVSPGEVMVSFELLITVAFLYSAVGIGWSSVAKNTTTAILLSYLTIGALFFIPLMLTIGSTPGVGSGMGGLPLRALNPMGAVFFGLDNEFYFGHPVPAWLTAGLVNLAFGGLITVVAVHRLEFPRVDRTWLLRILTLAFMVLVAVLLAGSLLTTIGSTGSTPPTGGTMATASKATQVSTTSTLKNSIASFLIIALPVLLAPLFATGAGLPKEGLWKGFDPRRLTRGEAPSGLVYSVLVAVVICGVMLSIAPANVELFRLAGLVVAVTLAGAGIGVLTSSLNGNRWHSLSLTMAILVMLYALPISIVAIRMANDPQKASVLDNLMYLSPITGAIETSTPGERIGKKPGDKAIRPNKPKPDSTMPEERLTLVFGDAPMANVTGGIYLGIALACLLLASTVGMRVQEKREASENATV